MFPENRDYFQIYIDVDVCIMLMNEWPKAEQERGDIDSDESSAILRDSYLTVTFSHTPLRKHCKFNVFLAKLPLKLEPG